MPARLMEGLVIRFFVAINIPAELKNVLEGVQSRLAACPGRISWVRPANIHLTLKFLGEVEETETSPIIEALSEVSSALNPFELCSNGLGGFPSMRAPRALWVGMDESRELSLLHEAIDKTLFKTGFKREKKAFHPHLTLCRIRSPKASREMRSRAMGVKVEKKVAFVVNRFVLYKSILSPAGARYEAIREFPLKGQRES